MTDWLLYLLFALSVYRVARLLAQEELARPARERVARKFGPESRWTYLAECPLCLSIWIGVLGVPFVVIWPDNRVVIAVLFVLAASALTVLLINKGEPSD